MNRWKVRENLKERLRDGSMLMLLAAVAIVSLALMTEEPTEAPTPAEPVAATDARGILVDPVPGP